MKVCVICESVYPLRNDATGKIAYFLAEELQKNNSDVTIVTKSFCSKRKYIKLINNIRFFVFKSEKQHLYSFVEICDLFKKNIIKLVYNLVKLFFLKLFSKTPFFKTKTDFFKMVDINDFPKEEFDVCILVAGNFELLTIIENGFVKSDKNVLYATDYWNENRFDHSVKTMFDVVYGRPSYLVDNNTFKKGFFNGGRLLVGSEFIDLKKAPPKIKKNLSYFGKLYGSRDYTSFLKILDSISKQIEKTNFQMIIYTDKVSLRKKYKNISFKNLVFGEKYYESLSDSDWLLVLDNTVEYQKWIPSKLYEAMLYKKPIVLFTDNPKSFSLVDIHLYDLFFIVDMNNFNDQTIAEFVEFLNKTDGKTSNIDLFSIFPECDKKNFYKQLMKDLYGEDLNQ